MLSLLLVMMRKMLLWGRKRVFLFDLTRSSKQLRPRRSRSHHSRVP
jgi:hypothetical protein